MNILITGGAGFIGSNFAIYWQKHYPDDNITIIDSLNYAANIKNLDSIINNIQFIKGNITDKEFIEDIFKNNHINKVVHFAAESHNDRALQNPDIFARVNVLGTHTLLEASLNHNIEHFHHISTDEVFGDIPLDQHYKFNEQTKYNPRSMYSASKAASDHLVNAYFHTYNLPITISNCSNNYGPYQHPEKFIPRSITKLLSGEDIQLYTPGNQIRDWLYVKDHCTAIDLILQKGKKGETYCIGGMTNEISNLEVAKLILKQLDLPEPRINFIKDRPGHDVKYAIDWSKIKTELNWQPKFDFEHHLQDTINWYKENKAWWQESLKESEQFYARL